MKRRTFIAATLALAAPAAAAAPPARLSLIDGGWRDGVRYAGIAIDLDDGWKTYWRVPGEGGIPPEFTWDGSRNGSDIAVLYPLPVRHDDASGEAIAYTGRVVFPVRLQVIDKAAPVDMAVSAFFGVCKDVCAPVKLTASAVLPSDGSDQGVAEWLAKVPQPAVPPLPVSGAGLDASESGVVLRLSLAGPVDDIFVEGPGDAYFHKPAFSGRQASLAVGNVKAGDLHGAVLKLTVVRGGVGVEQQLALP